MFVLVCMFGMDRKSCFLSKSWGIRCFILYSTDWFLSHYIIFIISTKNYFHFKILYTPSLGARIQSALIYNRIEQPSADHFAVVDFASHLHNSIFGWFLYYKRLEVLGRWSFQCLWDNLSGSPKCRLTPKHLDCPVDTAQSFVSQGHRMTCWAGLVNWA